MKLEEIKKLLDEFYNEYESNDSIILIDTGKNIYENFNTALLPNFNNFNYPYANLEIKYMRLICDLDITNQFIKELYFIWKQITTNSKLFIHYNTYLFTKLQKLNQYIIFDLKHFVDETISTIWILYNHPQDDSILICDTGDYLKDGNKEFKILDKYRDFFQELNDLFNSYKHSYLDNLSLALGKLEPCFTAIWSKNKKLLSSEKFICISVSHILTEFNQFYKESFKIIENLSNINIKNSQ